MELADPMDLSEPAPLAPPEVRFRFPLLREGSALVRAPGTLHLDATSGSWVITVRDDIDTEADREIRALPCETLEEMIGHIRGRTQVQWFEITALVLTYRNQNYLLPVMATPLSTEPPRPPASVMTPPGASTEVAQARAAALASRRPSLLTRGVIPAGAIPSAESTARRPTAAAPSTTAELGPAAAPVAAPATAPASDSESASASATTETAPAAPPAPVDPERFAADIERALEERITVIPRSGDAGSAPSRGAPTRSDRQFAESADAVLLPTDIRVQDRRGVVTRDPITGTWRFVIQGERTDMGERGIEILPCTALERMERFIRQSAEPPAILVSGRFTRFEGRNFLLPSSFRSISSGRWIFP